MRSNALELARRASGLPTALHRQPAKRVERNSANGAVLRNPVRATDGCTPRFDSAYPKVSFRSRGSWAGPIQGMVGKVAGHLPVPGLLSYTVAERAVTLPRLESQGGRRGRAPRYLSLASRRVGGAPSRRMWSSSRRAMSCPTRALLTPSSSRSSITEMPGRSVTMRRTSVSRGLSWRAASELRRNERGSWVRG
jgi:hypothetical protein